MYTHMCFTSHVSQAAFYCDTQQCVTEHDPYINGSSNRRPPRFLAASPVAVSVHSGFVCVFPPPADVLLHPSFVSSAVTFGSPHFHQEARLAIPISSWTSSTNILFKQLLECQQGGSPTHHGTDVQHDVRLHIWRRSTPSMWTISSRRSCCLFESTFEFGTSRFILQTLIDCDNTNQILQHVLALRDFKPCDIPPGDCAANRFPPKSGFSRSFRGKSSVWASLKLKRRWTREKFDEVLVSGRTEALNVMIEACRNVSSVRSHFVVVFSDVYLGVMKGGVVAHLSLVVSQSKSKGTPNDCLRTATRLVAEAACVWTDDADFMPQHDELAALLCAVTCEVNEGEIDAALEAFDHIDTDRLAI